MSCTGSSSCICEGCFDAAREREKAARSVRVELRDVLDLVDRWAVQQSGLREMRFSYETEHHQRVTIRIESTRGKAGPQ
ncbi:MAG: hypothetical protein KF894_34100 [Labilithrix sp.]|nr:hypothetical protein [Labilithrix sp.]